MDSSLSLVSEQFLPKQRKRSVFQNSKLLLSTRVFDQSDIKFPSIINISGRKKDLGEIYTVRDRYGQEKSEIKNLISKFSNELKSAKNTESFINKTNVSKDCYKKPLMNNVSSCLHSWSTQANSLQTLQAKSSNEIIIAPNNPF